MLFYIDVEETTTAWRVAYSTAEGPLLNAEGKPWTRDLSRCGQYPQPPAEELEDVKADDEHYKLCSIGAEAGLPQLLKDFADKTPARSRSNGVQALGRYLFATAFGDSVWSAIYKAAAAKPIELALSWKSGQQVLSALPWELMHSGARFLAQEPGVAIVRRVLNSEKPQPRTLSSPPKVLIVVGTPASDSTIQPGIEYVRLVQSLRDAQLDLSLRTFLLLEATQPRINAALTEFKPDIVHFISHGDIDQKGQPYLQILDDNGQPTPVYAVQLETMLNAALPHVVVLTACNSAKVTDEKLGQISTPLAEELVRYGIPLVVGMAGRIADQACRLFSSQFYTALLTGSDVAQASAAGRRAAIAGGRSDPSSTVEWVLPTVFFSDQIEDTRFEVELQNIEQRWQKYADSFAASFPPFCDRSEHMAKFDLLIAPEAVQRTVFRKAIQGLVLSFGRGENNSRYGCTRLMKEYAAKGTRDGHLVVFLQSRSGEQHEPTRNEDLLKKFKFALGDALRDFELACLTCGQEKELSCDSCRPVADALDVDKLMALPQEEMGEAIRDALLKILHWGREVRKPADPASMKLLLLIEDIHRLGDKPRDLLLESIERAFKHKDIRLVLSYSTVSLARTGGDEPKALMEALGKIYWIADAPVVGKLSRSNVKNADTEETTAYEYYLRNFYDTRNKQHLPVTIAPQHRAMVLQHLQEEVLLGIPGLFQAKNEEVASLLSWYRRSSIVMDADDDAVLQNLDGAGLIE